jgi:4-hydroxymandelate oxidase
VPVNVAELEQRARLLLAPGVYDYYAGGSGREETLRANAAAWRQFWLMPHVLRDVTTVDTTLRLPGRPETVVSTPVAVAPAAFQSLADPAGELATARGAAQAGALLVLSSRSSRRIEDVAEVVAGAGGAWWFQVYVMRDRDLTHRLVQRAATAGARALLLTADTPVVGHKRRDLSEVVIPGEDFRVNTGPLAGAAQAEQATDVTFADIRWLAEATGLPVIVKGVLRADDARACVAAGAAGVVVSNHGGRQLDRATPSALALPGVVAALRGPGAEAALRGPGDGAEAHRAGQVFVDGGLRTGEDLLTALALGARAVFLGRPVLWALACGGAEGVRDLLAGLTADLAHVMALAGARSLPETAGLVMAGPQG